MIKYLNQLFKVEYPREFWVANFMELLERAAYYGFFVVITLYLTDVIGFSDIETGFIAGFFSAGLYLLPPFVGALVDKIGFRKGLIIAFSLLTIGYTFLGIFHEKIAVIFFLVLAMVGGSFIKPLITGTVAKTTNEENRAKAYSLFYWIVNIGAFSGKTIIPSIRQGIGLQYVNFFSATMAFFALLFALKFYKQVDTTGMGKSFKEVAQGFIGILKKPRLLFLILIVTGFWLVQQQLYASMPKYVIRMIGEQAKPEWLANVNPLVVVIFVVWVTNLMKKHAAVTSIFVGMLIMPFSALAMAASGLLGKITGPSVSILGLFDMHPLTVMMVVGIALQGLAECFISPRFLEYFSLQAPKGEEGLYLGMSHLHSFFSAILGFGLSGFLLDKYCPDPHILPQGLSAAEKAAYYQHAHYIWYYFVGIGLVAAVSLYIYKIVTERIDRKKSVSN